MAYNAVSQLKKILDHVNHKFVGENVVFWGGREGFQSILNTQIKQGLDHHMAAIFMMMAIAQKKEKNNTTAQFLIGTEPKLCCESIKHQYYDYDP